MTDRPVLIERLRAVEAERVEEVEALTASLIEVNRQHAEDTIERDRWREDAERLAEALKWMVRGTDQVVELLDKYRNIPGNDSTVVLRSYADTARDALAAHDAMTKE